MSEMVERTAKAIAKVRCPGLLWPGRDDPEYQKICNGFLSEARAAIEAMREPTEAMKEAGTGFWDYTVGRSDSKAVWQLMIAAALASEDEGKRG